MSTSDHSSNGVEALQRFYQAESEYAQTSGEDFGPVAATLHPQIVMIQADSPPFGGQWHGPRGLREVDAGLRRGVELGQCNRSAVLRARRHRCGGRPDGGHGARQRTIFPRADLATSSGSATAG